MNDWTVETVAEAIDSLKATTNRQVFLGISDLIASKLGHGRNGQAVLRKLWAVMLRAQVYEFNNEKRLFLGVRTYGLDRLIGMSRSTRSVEMRNLRSDLPDPEYLANVLYVPISLVEEILKDTDPKQGIEGFGL